MSDLTRRILFAIPLVAAAIFIVTGGKEIFAAGLVVLGILSLSELYGLMRRARPVDLAGFVTVAGMIVLATYEERADVLMALVAAFPVVFLLALVRERLDNLAWGVATTIFGIAWIGLPLAHAVFLHQLPHGQTLLIAILAATFIGDTGAYLGGRAWGRTPLAPDISPNKTLEGLGVGILMGTLAFWVAGLYSNWLSGVDALAIGFLVAVTAPLGDLFESALKRDLEVKDTSTLFGPHGGVLDRLDAVFFTVVVGFYAALAFGYG